MASQIIRPFAEDEDRDAFGHWLSGFFAGEGCFEFRVRRPTGRTRLIPRWGACLTLRDDDSEILELIQSYWQCGTFTRTDHATLYPETNRKPTMTFTIGRLHDLLQVVVPHFERYPLRAKKKNDFAVWADAIRLVGRVRTGRPGNVPWATHLLNELCFRESQLSTARGYSEKATGEILIPDPQLWLFAG